LLVGIDIVDIVRIKMAVERTPRFLNRVFTIREIEYCFKKSDPYPSLAARFAAREALHKLDAIFITGLRFQDSEIIVDANGKPHLALHGDAYHRAQNAGIKDISVSLSHTKEQAIAIVIASKG
jgi:holo-[acyl-carrier protein] synthase